MTFIKNHLQVDFTQANVAYIEAKKRHEAYITAKTEYEAFLHIYQRKFGKAIREKFSNLFLPEGFLEITSSKNNELNGIYEYGEGIGMGLHFSDYGTYYQSVTLDNFSSVSTMWLSVKRVCVLKNGYRASYEDTSGIAVSFLIDNAKQCPAPAFKKRSEKPKANK